MAPQYYTPTIEEFHVGFEYEIFVPFRDWCEGDTGLHDNCKWVNATYNLGVADIIEKQLIRDIIRVKLLDRSDIEESGWGFVGEAVMGTMFSISVKTGLFSLLSMGTDKGLFKISINKQIPEGDNEIMPCRFNGLPRNKSELKRVMNQLGII